MSQSRTLSFVESLANTGVGFLISVAASFVIFPLLGMQTNAAQNIAAVVAFTFVSIARNYVIRRLFNERDNADS